MIMKFLLFSILLFGSAAFAEDRLVTLNKGECALLGQRVLCWSYLPSYLDRPSDPPQQCDLRKDCPITYSIPSEDSRRIRLREERFDLGGSIIRICKPVRYHGATRFKLYEVKINPNGTKAETELADFDDMAHECKAYENEYLGKHNPGDGVVVLDTYQKPEACPQVERVKIKRKTIKWNP